MAWGTQNPLIRGRHPQGRSALHSQWKCGQGRRRTLISQRGGGEWGGRAEGSAHCLHWVQEAPALNRIPEPWDRRQ